MENRRAKRRGGCDRKSILLLRTLETRVSQHGNVTMKTSSSGEFWRIPWHHCRGTHFGALEIYSIHLLYMALDHLDVKTSRRGVSSFSCTVRTLFTRAPPLRLWYNTPSNSYRWAIISGKFRKIAAIGWVWALWTFRENLFSKVGTYLFLGKQLDSTALYFNP